MTEKQLNPVLKVAMQTHRDLISILMSLREDQVKEMLDYELSDRRPRPSVVERLHQRWSILRMQRERAEMLSGLVSVKGPRKAEAA